MAGTWRLHRGLRVLLGVAVGLLGVMVAGVALVGAGVWWLLGAEGWPWQLLAPFVGLFVVFGALWWVTLRYRVTVDSSGWLVARIVRTRAVHLPSLVAIAHAPVVDVRRGAMRPLQVQSVVLVDRSANCAGVGLSAVADRESLAAEIARCARANGADIDARAARQLPPPRGE